MGAIRKENDAVTVTFEINELLHLFVPSNVFPSDSEGSL